MDQRHVALASVDQCLQIGVAPMAAGLAPDQHADIAGAQWVRGIGSSCWSARICSRLGLGRTSSRIRHGGCGGRAGKVELLTGIEGAAVKAYRATNLAVWAVLPISVGGQSGMVSSAMVPAKVKTGGQAEPHAYPYS